jgi:hypothetical protein
MVGPLSSEEIDDVVSSVRRLVSNEQRARPVTRDLGTERLVLTLAQRVVTEGSPLSTLILATPVFDAEEQSAATQAPVSAAAVWAEGDDEVVLVEADWEDDIWVEPAPILAEVALSADVAAIVPDGVVANADAALAGAEAGTSRDADWPSAEPIPFVPLRRRAESLALRLAGQGGQPDAAAVEAEPQDPAQAVATERLATEELATERRATEELATEAAAPPVALPKQPGPDASDDAPARAAADPKPDDLAFVHLDESPADAVMASNQATADMAGDLDATTELVDADGSSIAVLDESALQDLVRQMILEELQGPLGERITRNVRKLVRAEINRALIARDLD